MTNKTPAIISAVVTILLLILLAALSVFVQMLALNGVSERQGRNAIGTSLICQGMGFIFAAIVAGWISNLVINRFNWNKVLAVILAVIAGVLIGVAISFVSFIISIPVAGIG